MTSNLSASFDRQTDFEFIWSGLSLRVAAVIPLTHHVNGERHEAVTIEWLHELVYRAVLDAEDLLLDQTVSSVTGGPVCQNYPKASES
jgi:hypothetical protein